MNREPQPHSLLYKLMVSEDPLAWVRFLGIEADAAEMLDDDLSATFGRHLERTFIRTPGRRHILPKSIKAATSRPAPPKAPNAELKPEADPYSLETLREEVAIDAMNAIIEKDPQGFLSAFGLPGEAVEVIKRPDTFFTIAENNIKVTKDGKDSFLNLYIATSSLTVHVAKLLVDYVETMDRFGIEDGEAMAALLWDVADGFQQLKYGEVTETAHEGGRPVTRAQYKDISHTFQFCIMRFSNRVPEEILAGPSALYPFLGLTKVAPDELANYIARLRQKTSSLPHDSQREIWLRMRVFMELRFSVEETNNYLDGVWPMSDLRQSDTYNVIVEEGRVDGKHEMVTKLLVARFGQLPEEITDRVALLASDQLDELAVGTCNMSGLSSVMQWLMKQ